MRIAIVDDEPKIRRGLYACIESMRDDWRVTGTAEDGESALRLLERDPPDVLLLDMNMPGMDGLALLERVSGAYPAVRCIVVSGHAEFHYAQNAMRFGALDYLLKPIQPEKVEESLRKAAESIRRERTREEEQRYVESSRRELREKLMHDLIFGAPTIGEDEARRKAAKLELDLPRFVVVSLRARLSPEHAPESAGSILYELKGKAQAALEAAGGGLATADGTDGLALVLRLDSDPGGDDARIEAALRRFGSLGRGDAKLLVGAGRPCEALTEAARSYGEAAASRDAASPEEGAHRDESGYSLVVRGAIRYMREHYARNIKLSDIADSVYVHANYLSELFKKQTGENVVDYLTDIRVEAAKRLIVRNEYKIYMVADSVGFKEPRYFSQVFKKKTGLTPAEYKTKYGPS
ncbi:MAG TPA: response regulator [Paenibacillus sp.]|nr:response regulator [Paenibacillus sp.]